MPPFLAMIKLCLKNTVSNTMLFTTNQPLDDCFNQRISLTYITNLNLILTLIKNLYI